MVKEETHQSITGSKYGSGLCYSLALFLTHEANYKYLLAETEIMVAEGAIRFQEGKSSGESVKSSTIDRLAAIRWFSRAANPIRNLTIPDCLPKALQTRLRTFKRKSYGWSLPSSSSDQPTLKNIQWAVEEAKELLRLLDEHHGVQTVKEARSVYDPAKQFLEYRDA